MDFETFEVIITNLREIRDRSDAMHDLGVHLTEFDDPHFLIINHLLRAVFGEDGEYQISWFCYESNFGRDPKMKAWDAAGKPICRTVAELYSVVQPSAASVA